MPLTFPSHQGLIAPLWRRWPSRFHALGLCIGATVPDAVDGVVSVCRGYLDQSYGHSLFGLFVFCLPTGLLLTWLALLVGDWLAARAEARPLTPRCLGRLGQRIRRLHSLPQGASRPMQLAFVALSVCVGAFSHLLFDFVSHGNFLWLYPWYAVPRFFPSWWYVEWFGIPVLGFREPYPFGPHFIVWLFLSLLGIVVLVRPLRRRSAS